MATVTIDTLLCTGCGLCASMCPEMFEVGEDNIAYIKDANAECDVDEVAASCPVEAIKVQ